MNLLHYATKVGVVGLVAMTLLMLAACTLPVSTSVPTVPEAEAGSPPAVERSEPAEALTKTVPMTMSVPVTMSVPMTMSVPITQSEEPKAAVETPAMPQAMSAVSASDPVTVAVALDLFLFKPERIEINRGDTVIWTNTDDIQHTVTVGTPQAPGDGFDSGFFTLDQTFSRTFTEPGEYPYFCRRHPHMQGVIVVN